MTAFARDPATASYYDQRAAEYDEWWLDLGQYATRERPGWHACVAEVVAFVQALPTTKTLDIACGSGFLTQHLRGLVIGLDQSPSMVAIAQSRLPGGVAMIGDALDLPYAAGTFEHLVTGHFYGHLPVDERDVFLAEARRVARELVVIDSAARPGVAVDQIQPRVLNDGSEHRVYKRYFTGSQLAAEIGGSVLLENDWFVAAGVRF